MSIHRGHRTHKEIPRQQPGRRLSLGEWVFLFALSVLFLHVLQLDVLLRIGRGEVLGWVRPTFRSDTNARGLRAYLDTDAQIEPLVAKGGPAEFVIFSPGVFWRLYDAYLRSAPPPLLPPDRPPDRLPGMAHGSQTPGRRLLCRLRYAGLGRYVVYDFQTYPPTEEARLRREAKGLGAAPD